MTEKHSHPQELVIPSDLDRIHEVEDFADKIAAKLNLPHEERDSLAIAVTETANNAIIHGNKKNRQKQVKIRFSIDKKKLIITVKDEGTGFNPQEIDDPRSPENLLKERGRGIFIVRTLMNEVNFKFDGDGMRVTLIKYLK